MNDMLLIFAVIVTVLAVAALIVEVAGWLWFRFVTRYTVSPTDAVADLYLRQQSDHTDD